ncbi:DRAP deaminase [Dispira parvispora]|uniref:DRAP deaminase n=1 Tax=Dispira parvispora TaxID=1520584 RepID=A0A9W8AW49_9FUNG|nr:DRAP deaminase [Dispira parvispora]
MENKRLKLSSDTPSAPNSCEMQPELKVSTFTDTSSFPSNVASDSSVPTEFKLSAGPTVPLVDITNATATPTDIPPRPRSRRKRVEEPTPLNMNDVEYYFENGLRKVKPYAFCYSTFVKGRWQGRTLLDVFTTEFRDQEPSYYRRAIEQGWITINGQKSSPETLLKGHDYLTHRIHRHEPPVTAQSPRVVYQSEDVVVVDKPASMPVHPSGRYHHNTLLHILYKEFGFKELSPVNRLDRLTSGIVILARTTAVAQVYKSQMADRVVRKEYICKVWGDFPTGLIQCQEPVKTVAFKLGLNAVHPEGKPSKTWFEKIGSDGPYSLVKCRPVTGRTHQIRVHLQYLGFPIANDPLYCNPKVWGTQLGKAGETQTPEVIDRAIQNLTRLDAEKDARQRADVPLDQLRSSKSGSGEVTVSNPECPNFTSLSSSSSSLDSSPTKETQSPVIEQNRDYPPGFDPQCIQCQQYLISPIPDPKPDQLLIWLHAYSYEADNWAYETSLPSWCQLSETDVRPNKDSIVHPDNPPAEE